MLALMLSPVAGALAVLLVDSVLYVVYGMSSRWRRWSTAIQH